MALSGGTSALPHCWGEFTWALQPPPYAAACPPPCSRDQGPAETCLSPRLPTGMSGPRPVVLSGPSGAGKSTLLKKLLQEHGSIFGFSVSREAPGRWGRVQKRLGTKTLANMP